MPKPPEPVVIILEAAETAILNGSWAGPGGFQNLAPKLQQKLSAQHRLELTDEELGIIMRYMSYEQSGFRDRIRKVFKRSLTELMERK
jgi:hypothetical protein